MPFTLAHPAAVLPLMRRPLDGLALVCGAMAPDIPYFVRSTPLNVTAQSWYEPFANATTSHSMAGLLPVTLLWALVLYFMLRAATPPVTWLLQGGWDPDGLPSTGAAPARADGGAMRGTTQWVWVPVSLLIGALTHLVWDSLTSSGGFLAEHIDALNETAVADLTWVRSMQHVSTLVGLTIVAVALRRHHRALVSNSDPSLRQAGWVLIGLVAVGALAGVTSVVATFDPSGSSSTPDLVEGVLATAMTGGGAAVAVAVAMSTACWWIVQPATRRRS